MYKIILFDLDNRLLDFSCSESISLKKVHAKYYSDIEYQYFEKCFTKINTALWEEIGNSSDTSTARDIGWQRFINLNYTLQRAYIDHNQVADDYENSLAISTQWLPDVKPVIEFLHQQGFILGIVTNGIKQVQYKKYQLHQLEKWFNCFTVSDEVGVSKPNPEIFHHALTKIITEHKPVNATFAKKSILMVGDSLTSDGYGARNAKIDFCYINNKNTTEYPQDITIKHQVRSVGELPKILGKYHEFHQFLASKSEQEVLVQ